MAYEGNYPEIESVTHLTLLVKGVQRAPAFLYAGCNSLMASGTSSSYLLPLVHEALIRESYEPTPLGYERSSTAGVFLPMNIFDIIRPSPYN